MHYRLSRFTQTKNFNESVIIITLTSSSLLQAFALISPISVPTRTISAGCAVGPFLLTKGRAGSGQTRLKQNWDVTMDTPTLDFGARLSLRCYQLRIVQEAMQYGNTLVILPTGSGKTLIAAEVARRVGAKVLFLVPTRLLVEQQAKAVREWTCMRVEE